MCCLVVLILGPRKSQFEDKNVGLERFEGMSPKLLTRCRYDTEQGMDGC